jgi:Lar family restriction alleviation protein
MSEELKPCPFCGSLKFLEGYDSNDSFCDIRWVVCRGCGSCGPRLVNKAHIEAIAAWNRRPEPPRREAEQRVYNELHAYYQDLIMPGGAIGREELLARLAMLADEAGGMFTPAKGKEKKP